MKRLKKLKMSALQLDESADIQGIILLMYVRFLAMKKMT
jgi:hypothetical protein